MKRSFFLSLVLVLGLGAFLAGCAGSDEEGVSGDRNRAPLDERLDDDNNNKCTGPLCDENADSENTDTLCADGIDNDGDGLTDCADVDCSGGVSVTVCRVPYTGNEYDDGRNDIDRDEGGGPVFEITEPSAVEVELPSALYGRLYEAYEIRAGEGSGDYSWNFVDLTEEELTGVGLTGDNVYGHPPTGMELVPQTANADEQVAIIRGRPRDELGSYGFKVKVTDNVDTTRSDERVFTIRLADKIVIDVYEQDKNKGSWTLKPLSRRSGGNFSNTGYASIAEVTANINVSADKTLKLVARGNGDVSNYRWCLWGGMFPVCSSSGNVDNGYFKLVAEKMWSGTKTGSNNTSVRYLSAGNSFSTPTGNNGTLPITVDDLEGNASLLYFKTIDFDCHGQISGYHSSPTIKIMGNMSTNADEPREVHKTLRAFGGSEGNDYVWSYRVLNYGPSEFRDRIKVSLSDTNSSTEKNINFRFKAPGEHYETGLLSLKQYHDLLEEDFLVKVKVSVIDEVCDGSDFFVIEYKLSDLERDENGNKIGDGNHLYLDPTSSMDIIVNFDEGNRSAVNETHEDSKMIVKLREKERNGGSDEEYCGESGNTGEYWHGRGRFVIGLDDCPYNVNGETERVDCSGQTELKDANHRIDNIDIACIKFVNGGDYDDRWAMGVTLDNIELKTPHWETTYYPDGNFHAGCGSDSSNVTCGGRNATRTINITDDFWRSYSGDSPSLLDKWKLRVN